MKIDEDIKRIIQSLLGLSTSDKETVVTIYSQNYSSRHPDAPFYQYSQSVLKMVNDGLLQLINSGENGQPSKDNSVIHYFPYYKVTFLPKVIKDYLDSLDNGIRDEIGNRVFSHKNLYLNIIQGTIRYSNKPAVEISPATNEVKLLILLLENLRVVEYLEIAQKLELNSYHEGCTNKDMARDVQFIKRDLLKFLRVEVGIPKQEVKSLIITKRNLGFKLSW